MKKGKYGAGKKSTKCGDVMSQSITELPGQPNAALANTWGKYREFAATSRKKKKRLEFWRCRVLILGIAGAVPENDTPGIRQKRLGLDTRHTGWAKRPVPGISNPLWKGTGKSRAGAGVDTFPFYGGINP